MKQVAILGSGGFGTALAVLLARVAPTVWLWGRDPEQAAELAARRENARHLPGIRLPPQVRPTADAARAAGADLLVVAIPTAFLRATLTSIARQIPPGIPALSVVKGIEIGTFARPSQIILDVLGPRPVAILSGPRPCRRSRARAAGLGRRRRPRPRAQ